MLPCRSRPAKKRSCPHYQTITNRSDTARTRIPSLPSGETVAERGKLRIAGADDALADALGSLTLKKGAPNAPPTTHLPGTSAPPPTAPLADDQFDFDFSSTDEDDYEPRDDATTGASDTDSQDEADTTDEEDVVELPPRAQPEGRHSGSAAKSAEESASSGVECVADTESEGQAGSEEEDEDVFEVSPSAQSDGVKSRAAVTTAAPVTDDWLLTHKDERFQLTHSVHTMLYTHQVRTRIHGHAPLHTALQTLRCSPVNDSVMKLATGKPALEP